MKFQKKTLKMILIVSLFAGLMSGSVLACHEASDGLCGEPDCIRVCISDAEKEISAGTRPQLRAVLPDQAGWGPDTTATGSCGNGMTWALSESGVLTVHGSGKMKDFTKDSLPSWNLFKNGIKHIVFSDDITRIGSYVFYLCTSVESVELPKNLEVIGESAFMGCTDLEEVVFPESVTEIGPMAFAINYGLKEVVLPEKLTEISGGCFGMCTGLEQITIPAGVTYIDEVAFMQCTKLERVYYGGASRDQVTIHEEDNEAIINAEWICQNSAEGYINTECSNIYVMPPNTCEYAHVVIAAYDLTGKMINVQAQQWTTGEELAFEFRTLEDAADVRMFLLDENYAPVQDAVPIEEAAGSMHIMRGSVTQKATCTEPGIKTYLCTKCSYSCTESIPNTGHTWNDATCLEPETCSGCSQTRGDALGHSYAGGFCIRCNEPQPVAVTGIKLNKTTLKLGVDANETLTATVTPANATDKTVVWTSSDESVVSVNASGKLTGVNPGTAVITATAGKFTAKCTVTVEVVAVDSESSNAAFAYLARKCQEEGRSTGVRGEYMLSWVDENDTYTLTYSVTRDELLLGCVTDGTSVGEYIMTIPASMKAPFLTEYSLTRDSLYLNGKMYISPYTLSEDYSPLSFHEYTGDSDYRSNLFNLSCIQSELCVLVLNQQFLKGSKYDVEDLGFEAILGGDLSAERATATALANTILKYGTSTGSAGAKYVGKNYSFSNGTSMQVKVYAYANNDNRISFSAKYSGSGSMETTTSIWYQIDGHGAGPLVGVDTLSSNPFGAIYTQAPFDCRTYEFGEDLDFFSTFNSANLPESTWESLSNAGFKLAMRGFNDILVSKFGVTLQEIGFDSYVES